MSGWIIWNKSARKWVAYPGLASSYTKNILDARRFPSQAAAEAECCGDEVVRNISDAGIMWITT